MSETHLWRYERARPRYEQLTAKTELLIRDLLRRNKIKATIESRTKAVESFGSKISRPGKSYEDPLAEVTDLSGIRIILYSSGDVKKVRNILAIEFKIDLTKSVRKGDDLPADRFGYLSKHLIVQVSASRERLPEWCDLTGLFTEIQIRTLLQHTWASIEHVLVYKSQADAPRSLRRRLSRLSALFELADEELDHLLRERSAQTVEYASRLGRGERDVPIDVDSLRTYIDHSAEVKYWNQFLRETVKVAVGDKDFGGLSRLVRFTQRFDLHSIDELNALLVLAHGWGEHFLSEYFLEQFRAGMLSSPERVHVVGSGALTMLMIAAKAENISPEEMNQSFGWGGGATLLKVAVKARGL